MLDADRGGTGSFYVRNPDSIRYAAAGSWAAQREAERWAGSVAPQGRPDRFAWFSVPGVLGAGAQDCWDPVIKRLRPGSQRGVPAPETTWELVHNLLVTQAYLPRPSHCHSLAGQKFSSSIILGGKVAGSLEPEAPRGGCPMGMVAGAGWEMQRLRRAHLHPNKYTQPAP